MKAASIVLGVLCGLPVQLHSQDIGVRPAPCVTWTATNGQTYTIECAAAVTGTWSTAATIYTTTSGPTAWADPSDQPGAYYRVSYYSNGSHTITEDFEDAGGWTDHSFGIWTNFGTTGKWVGWECSATSAPGRAHSPVRCIGMNADWQRLYLPVGGLVTQLLVWYRGSQETSQQAVFRLVGSDGGEEFQIGNLRQVDAAGWTSTTWTITSPETWAFYYIETFWTYSPIYFDDITLRY